MNWRKNHRIVSLVVILPFSVVLISGLFLQIRSKVEWIQPETMRFEKIPGKEILNFDELLEKSRLRKEEVSQVIFRPAKFNYSIRLNNYDELQIHPQTGEVHKRKKRWTSFLIELHQGSFFSGVGQYFIFFPAGLGLLFLMISGVMIYPRRKKYEK
jgi:uncharacterized iron-regulated membrane protein